MSRVAALRAQVNGIAGALNTRGQAAKMSTFLGNIQITANRNLKVLDEIHNGD